MQSNYNGDHTSSQSQSQSQYEYYHIIYEHNVVFINTVVNYSPTDEHKECK
jgi:hypothetical protein